MLGKINIKEVLVFFITPSLSLTSYPAKPISKIKILLLKVVIAMIYDSEVMNYLRDDLQNIEIELSIVAHRTHTTCGIAHPPLNDKISAAKFLL